MDWTEEKNERQLMQFIRKMQLQFDITISFLGMEMDEEIQEI